MAGAQIFCFLYLMTVFQIVLGGGAPPARCSSDMLPSTLDKKPVNLYTISVIYTRISLP